MPSNPEVEAWFESRQPPNEEVMRRVRAVLLSADPRMTEYIRYGSLLFGHDGDLVSFVQVAKRGVVSLMFNRGAHIPGDFPHLEGKGPTARFMRFKSTAEVDARADELRRIAVAWCDTPVAHSPAH